MVQKENQPLLSSCDETEVQTARIQAAIDLCAETGGGEIVFEAGVYRTGTLWLRSGTYLRLPYGCRIKGSDSFDDYNEPDLSANTPIPPERAFFCLGKLGI